jgi:xylan 1,4-beta-xylosidase
VEETIHNPVLKGFNPDPSIIRVEDDYYIATSTFQWFPGVQIHHSRDLINWQLLTRPLDRIKQLNMKAVPDSAGIWAPCLTWDDGTFYLVYTVTDELNDIAKDLNNYLVTSEDITGPWSDPVYLNSSGFDPSLFHDDDGRKWLVNMVWDHRPGRIVLQEYSPSERKLIGKPKMIFEGTDLGSTEAPHLYRHNGCYYLLTAEGGTGWEHAVTVARAEQINGPYQIHPDNPILTSAGDRSLALQKAGHADIVQTQNGEWYMAHLSSRPLPRTDRCILGRETSLQKIVWKNNWPYLASGQNRPQEHVPGPNLPAATGNTLVERDDFDSETLGIDFQTLRVPLDEDSLSLTERPGFLATAGLLLYRQNLP